MKELFLQRSKEYFGNKYDEFLKKLKEPLTHGFFLNTLKGEKRNILNLINFEYEESQYTENSYKHKNESIGKTISYDLGLIYPQGIEAAIPASLPKMENVKYILDMCAAPGGKTINIANRMSDDTVLISNEYTFKRTQALLSNIERMGIDNVVVTNKDGATLSKELYKSIDLVLLDAPCSGEGMIRKYPEIIDDYNLGNIENLSKIQFELLEDAYKCLKDSGQLVYSTCTYSYEEDENQIDIFLNNHHDMELLKMKKYSILDDCEGQFVAYMVKHGDNTSYSPKERKTVRNNVVEKFINENLDINDYYLYLLNKRYYLSLIPLPDLKDNVLRYGTFIGTLEKDRFIPEHHLYRSNKLSSHFKNVYEINDDEYKKYISGNQLKANINDGYYLIKYKGYSLGFVKASKGLLNNKYPKGLRRI